MLRCTSSKSRDQANSDRSTSPLIAAKPRSIAARSSAASMPAAASMRACASDPAMSAPARRWSKSTDAVYCFTISASGSLKRPDQPWAASLRESDLSADMACLTRTSCPQYEAEVTSPGGNDPDLLRRATTKSKVAAPSATNNAHEYKSKQDPTRASRPAQSGNDPADFAPGQRGGDDRGVCPRGARAGDLRRVGSNERDRRAAPAVRAAHSLFACAMAGARAVRGWRCLRHCVDPRGRARIQHRASRANARRDDWRHVSPRYVLVVDRGCAPVLFSAAFESAFAGDYRGAVAGAAGPHPAAFPVQQHHRGIVVDAQRAEARGSGAGRSGG